MVLSPSVSFAVLAAAAVAGSANAHSYMILPLPTWEQSYGINSPSGTIEGDTYLPIPDGMSYSTDPLSNTEAYWTAFNASSYTSLRDFLTSDTQDLQTASGFGTATVECGFSLADGTARDLPAEVEWNQLTSSHEGPMEIWCDDTLVFEDWNAAADYTTDPAVLPYDSAKCAGASMLTSYWLALHTLPWQVYTNCAPLTGDYSSSVAASAQGDASSTTSTTATSDSADAGDTSAATEADGASASESASKTDDTTSTTTTTTAPTATTATPTSTTTAPTATTAAPTTTTATPTATTATSDKCSVRRSRN